MDSDQLEWVKEARKLQNIFFNYHGNRLYDAVDIEVLHDKIGFAIYGCPEETTYNKEQEKRINELKNTIICQSGFNKTVYLAFVYVVIKVKSSTESRPEVVFRVGLANEENKEAEIFEKVFIDSTLRVYKSWEDYMKSNKLPECFMSWPDEGFYRKDKDGIVNIKFGESHACDLVSTALEFADVASLILGGVGFGIELVSLFKPLSDEVRKAGRAATAVSGSYIACRNTVKLMDMHDHKESIGLGNLEAREAWFSAVSSTLGAVSAGTSMALVSSQKYGAISEGTMNLLKISRILNICSGCVSGVSAIHNIITVVKKCKDGNCFEKKDVFNVVISCLFLFNAVVSMEIADRMIREISKHSINMIGGTTSTVASVNPMLVVKSTSKNYGILLSLIIGIPASCVVYINRHLIEKIIEDADAAWNGEIKLSESNISEYLRELWNETYKNTVDTTLHFIDKCELLFKEEIRQITPRPLNIATFHEMFKIFRDTTEKISFGQNEEQIKENEEKILCLANKFNSLKPAKDLVQYCFKFNYFCKNFLNKFDSFKDEYEHKRDIAMEKRDFNLRIFNYRNGIGTSVTEHLFERCIECLYEEFDEMFKKYEEEEEKFLAKPDKYYDPTFQHCVAGSVFPFCFPSGKLDDDVYFSCAKEFSGVNIDRSNSKIVAMEHLVELRPLLESGVPRVIFYTANHGDDVNYKKGIAVVTEGFFNIN